jgi:hypothetical protein
METVLLDVSLNFGCVGFGSAFLHGNFQGITYKYSGLRSDNNSETRLLKPLSRIISAFSRRVKKIIVGRAFRQFTNYCRN